MTTFEEMESAWKAQSAKLDQVSLLLTNQLRRDRVTRIKTPLHRLVVSLWFEIALSSAGMLLLGNYLAEHLTQARYVWPAALMDLWFGGTLIASIRQLLGARAVHYDEPIAVVQQQLGRLRISRLKMFRWLFLTGQIVWWIPFLITSLQMLFRVDAYRYLSPGFILVNILAGLALVPLSLLVLRRFRFATGASWYERLADVIAGQSLAEAQRQAEALADFIDDSIQPGH
jgi:hypothetical protein